MMEAVIGVIVTLLVANLVALLSHMSKCNAFHERVARLEQWQQSMERRESQR